MGIISESIIPFINQHNKGKESITIPKEEVIIADIKGNKVISAMVEGLSQNLTTPNQIGRAMLFYYRNKQLSKGGSKRAL